MSASFFDSKSYYRLTNDRNGANRSLSSGLFNDPPGPLDMVQSGSYSSENWQLFYQDGIYFLRNYDYGAGYQLGVTDDNRSVPQLLPPSGLLGMQWNITQWQDGTWKLTNGLLGSVPLLGVGADSTIPAMNGDQSGAHWVFDINVSAGRIDNTTQLSAFPSLETAKSTATASPTSSRSTISTSSTSPPKSTPTNTEQDHSHSLPVGAIAGIAVGSVAVVLGLMILLFLLRRSRRRKQQTKVYADESPNAPYLPENKPDSTTSPPSPPSEQWTTVTRSELPDTETPPDTRAEMPGDSPPARRNDAKEPENTTR